ncbi:MAG: TRAP transporter small permease subunit [Dehalococcoidales bacterium]|nr:TRAP transporter small permease subunit [Dehalococcoidales bacterium]
MLKVTSVLERIENYLSVVSYCALMVMVILGAFDVIGRYIFNRPIFGALEISKALLTCVVVLYWAKAQNQEKHVAVDVISIHFPQKVKAVLKPLFLLIGLVFFFLIAWRTIVFGLDCWEQNRLLDTVRFPQGIVYHIISLGATLTCIEMCFGLYRSIVTLKSMFAGKKTS